MQRTNTECLALYGAGGHCKVVIDILDALGINPSLIVDDNATSKQFMGISVSAPSQSYDQVIITIGDCEIRKKVAERISVNSYLTVVHPSAIVCKNVPIGEGTVVVHGAIVQSSAKIGRHCIINTKASVGHDVTLNDFVHVASGATVCGGSEVGECTWIGAGSVVKQGVRIGKNCMIGAGAAVIRDVPDGAVVAGVPAKIIKYKPGYKTLTDSNISGGVNT